MTSQIAVSGPRRAEIRVGDKPSTWDPPSNALYNSLSSKRMQGLAFEWDPRKDLSNRRKHRVAFAETSTVFGDLLSITISDPDHGAAEERFVTIGMSDKRRPGSGSYCERRADAIDQCSRRDIV